MISSSDQAEQFRVPTTGMRGGLGRTLLTAFLVLAIVPLSTLSWYATHRERRDIQREVTAKLSSVATMMQGQVREWTEGRLSSVRILALMPSARDSAVALARDPEQAEEGRDVLRSQFEAVLKQDQALRRLALLDHQGHVLVSTSPPDLPSQEVMALLEGGEGVHIDSLDPSDQHGAVVTQPIVSPQGESVGLLVGWLDLEMLSDQLRAPHELGSGGEVYLVDSSSTALPHGKVLESAGIEAALSGEPRDGLYKNYAGEPVIGVYRWIPDFNLALVAEQSQEEALAVTDNVTAAIVGASLLVALVTAIIAA
jgi:hypothetical protein